MSGICRECARRAWLLAKLGSRLDREIERHEQSRLWSLLELPDLELINAIGQQRRAELQTAYANGSRRRDVEMNRLRRFAATTPRFHGTCARMH